MPSPFSSKRAFPSNKASGEEIRALHKGKALPPNLGASQQEKSHPRNAQSEHPRPCQRHVWSLQQRGHEYLERLQKRCQPGLLIFKDDHASKADSNPRPLGPGRTHVLGVHRSKREACWKRPTARGKPSERLSCPFQEDNS